MERYRETDVHSVTVERSDDGTLRQTEYSAPIQVRVSHFTVESDEDGESIDESWELRLKYRVDDGLAKLIQAKDIDGSDCYSDWTGFGFLRTIPAVEEKLLNITGIDEVERVEETLGRQVEYGREADFNPE